MSFHHRRRIHHPRVPLEHLDSPDVDKEQTVVELARQHGLRLGTHRSDHRSRGWTHLFDIRLAAALK
jgi:hypothetical protein